MFIYKGLRQQLAEERNKNNELSERLQQSEANIDYLAMMTDVELESEEVAENVE